MTYRARQYGASITEVPIKFVDREAGESKMSSFIVFEALGLVTFWGLGRIVHGRGGSSRARAARRLLRPVQVPPPPLVVSYPGGAATTPTDTEDRSGRYDRQGAT